VTLTGGLPQFCHAKGVKIFLVDGTYELFRQYFGRPSHLTKELVEVGAVRGVLGSTLQLIEDGATHVGVATDHVIESYRNEMWAGYKTGAGIDPPLYSQFPLLEEALMAMGVATWPMVELEADDGLASAAAIAADDPDVEQVVILTPDKDLAQCVKDGRVVQVDRRNNVVFDEAGVEAKFGVPPRSIPDYLGLVGDSADGFPGIQGWGAKSTATVLREYGTIENIPDDATEWSVKVRGAVSLASTLADNRDDAMLFKQLATLRIDRDLVKDADAMKWRGPGEDFVAMCERLEQPSLVERAEKAAKKLGL
jgi:5'-3' exonuclease